jgi:hypothetical protein
VIIVKRALMKRFTWISIFLFLIPALWIFPAKKNTAVQKVVMQVSEICLVSVTGSPQRLVITGDVSAGNVPKTVKDETTHVQYTSTVSRGGRRSLTVRWNNQDAAPTGCVLVLEALPSGNQNEGMSAGKVELSSLPKTLISNIGSCVTGRGASSGALLVYSLAVKDVTRLRAGENKTATVTFTLTDIS